LPGKQEQFGVEARSKRMPGVVEVERGLKGCIFLGRQGWKFGNIGIFLADKCLD